MNAAYAFGTRLTNAFDMHGWCAAIRGVEGGGLVKVYLFIPLKPVMVKWSLNVQLKLRSRIVVKKNSVILALFL
jgi:predicted component of type VI protein secretion system